MPEDTQIGDALVEAALPEDMRRADAAAPGGYRFDVDLFEGPLDLLLHLI